jgi:hypothetical protein
MRIYSLGLSDGTQRLDTFGYQSILWDEIGRGKAYEGPWTPMPLRLLGKNPGSTQRRELKDVTGIQAGFPYLLFATRVKAVLQSECGIIEQWLPVDFPEKEYWLLNVTHTIDALDLTRTEIKRFRDGGINRILSYSFRHEAVAPEWLFKVTTSPYHMLCTEPFVALANAHGWSGLFFWPVWDSEHAPFPVSPLAADIQSRPEIYGPLGFVKGYEDAWPIEWHAQAHALREATKGQDLPRSK